MRFSSEDTAGFWDPARAAARGSTDRPRSKIPSGRERPCPRSLQPPPRSAGRRAYRGVRRQPRRDHPSRDRDSASPHVLGRSNHGCRLLRRPRHARADRRGTSAPRITASVVIAVPCMGATAVITPAGRFLGLGGQASRGVCRRTTVARFTRRRAAVEARGDCARGRPVRAPASVVHVPARLVMGAAARRRSGRHVRYERWWAGAFRMRA